MPAARPQPIPPHERARARAREAGFGVIEIMVVVVIIAILMAIVIPQFFSAKTTAKSKDALAAAASYDQAIARFQSDHANRLPAGSDMMAVAGKPAGPRNLLGRPYLGAVPEAVTSGRVVVNMACGGGAPTGAVAAVIAYCPEAAPNYGIRVTYRDSSTTTKTCWRGRTARTPKC